MLNPNSDETALAAPHDAVNLARHYQCARVEDLRSRLFDAGYTLAEAAAGISLWRDYVRARGETHLPH